MESAASPQLLDGLMESCPASGAAGNSSSFPAKLHRMLTDAEEQEGGELEKVVSWAPHGRSFKVHDKKTFLAEIMPRYFYQLKYNSFQRQLNLYGFKKIQHQGKDKGSFYHEHFLRGMPGLTSKIRRTKGKGDTGRPRASEAEPNFYAMPPLPSSGNTSASSSVSTRESRSPPPTTENLERQAGVKRVTPDSPFTKPDKDSKRSKRDAEMAFDKSLQALMGQNAAATKSSCDRVKAVPGSSSEGLPSVLDFMLAGMEDSEPIDNSNVGESRPSAALDSSSLAFASLAQTNTAFQSLDKAGGSFSSSVALPFDLEPTPIMPGMALCQRQPQQQQQIWPVPGTNGREQAKQGNEPQGPLWPVLEANGQTPQLTNKAAAQYPTPAAGLWYDEPVDEYTLELADISTSMVRGSRSMPPKEAAKKKAPPPRASLGLPTSASAAASHECHDDCGCLQKLLSRSIDHPESLPQNGFGYF